LHWRIFRVFCCAAARSGNKKNGPDAAPRARAPLPVHLMKSRRDRPSCFFFAISLPSEEQTGPGSSLYECKKLARTDNATGPVRESIGGTRLFHAPTSSQILVPCVSFKSKLPTTKVMPATIIG